MLGTLFQLLLEGSGAGRRIFGRGKQFQLFVDDCLHLPFVAQLVDGLILVLPVAISHRLGNLFICPVRVGLFNEHDHGVVGYALDFFDAALVFLGHGQSFFRNCPVSHLRFHHRMYGNAFHRWYWRRKVNRRIGTTRIGKWLLPNCRRDLGEGSLGIDCQVLQDRK